VNLRFAAVIVVATLAATAARAAEYIIVPLIGDRITIANARFGVGSNLDRNEYHTLPLPQLPFYDAMERAIASEVRKVDAEATFKPLAFKNGLPGVDLERESAAEVAAKSAKALASVVKPGEKQWLVLLLPVRTQPRMRLADGHIGSGRAGGLGFYVDRNTGIRRGDTQETDIGFLGVFANFAVLRVDPASGAIAAQELVQDGYVESVAGSGKSHPWDVATPERKVGLLNRLVAEEIRKAMPGVLAGLR
jgi:hypothetical protein